MPKSTKPKMVGTVLPADYRAKVQVIDFDTHKWVTRAECACTPNMINEAIRQARIERPGEYLWVREWDGNRVYIGDQNSY